MTKYLTDEAMCTAFKSLRDEIFGLLGGQIPSNTTEPVEELEVNPSAASPNNDNNTSSSTNV